MVRLTLRNRLAGAVLVVLEVGAFFALSVRIARNYLADRARESSQAEELRRAIELDPGNADFHLRLGRLALYSVTEADSDAAIAHLQRAAQLSPRRVQIWLELSATESFQGNVPAAEAFLRRADMLAPNLPSIQWVVGNFYLLQGNTDEAFKHFKITLNGGHDYDRILFRTAWRASEDGARILNDLIPRRLDTEFSYIYFLLDEGKLTDALPVWARISSSGEKFDPVRARGLMDRLLIGRMPDKATQVWNDLRDKGLIVPTYQASPKNLMINGNFEEDILNEGFDWRVAKAEDIHAAPDDTTFHSPGRSFRVIFPGKTNLAYAGLYQFVRVEPNRKYRLQAFIKSDGITTDSGPRLRVVDIYAPANLIKFSDDIIGTSPGWNLVTLEFSTTPTTELITITLVRQPSLKLDNLIAGTVWLDDVSLAPSP